MPGSRTGGMELSARVPAGIGSPSGVFFWLVPILYILFRRDGLTYDPSYCTTYFLIFRERTSLFAERAGGG